MNKLVIVSKQNAVPQVVPYITKKYEIRKPDSDFSDVDSIFLHIQSKDDLNAFLERDIVFYRIVILLDNVSKDEIAFSNRSCIDLTDTDELEELRELTTSVTGNVEALIAKYMNGYLVQGVLHDLNNPLGTASLTFQLIEETLDDAIEDGDFTMIKTFLGNVLSTFDTINNITKTFMKFVTYRSSEKELFNVLDTLREVNVFMNSRLKRVGIHVEYPTNEGLIYAFKHHFNQIIMMLLLIISDHSEELKEVNIVLEKNLLLFNLDQKIASENDFYNSKVIPMHYVKYLMRKYCSLNNFEISIKESTLAISFVDEME